MHLPLVEIVTPNSLQRAACVAPRVRMERFLESLMSMLTEECAESVAVVVALLLLLLLLLLLHAVGSWVGAATETGVAGGGGEGRGKADAGWAGWGDRGGAFCFQEFSSSGGKKPLVSHIVMTWLGG